MSVLLKILVITKNFWKLYLLCLTLVLVVSAFNLVQPLIIKHIVDLVTVYLSYRNPVFEQSVLAMKHLADIPKLFYQHSYWKFN